MTRGETGEQAKDRERAIERYDVLGRPPAPDLEALARLAGQLCDAPYAAVDLITSTEQHRVATVGVAPSQCVRDESPSSVMLGEPALVVRDAGSDPRLSASPWVTGERGWTRFLASAPLVSPQGTTLGRLCVFDDVPRDLGAAQLEALQLLAQRVVDALELRLRTRELEDAVEELADARDDLRRSQEHLTLFAGQVSHDLRTPLTAILANAEMLAGESAVAADDEIAWMVDGISRGALRLNTMIEAILAHVRAGGDPSPVDTDLGQVVDLVLSDLAGRVAEAGARVEVGDLPTVRVDAHGVYSVLLNLLTNALTFVRAGVPPEVTVSAERRDGRWRVSVRDNGIGIPGDRHESVFVLFARVDKRVAGHGIGLATVRRIVEAHGGRVGVESGPDAGSPDAGSPDAGSPDAGSPDAGSTVWFELPA